MKRVVGNTHVFAGLLLLAAGAFGFESDASASSIEELVDSLVADGEPGVAVGVIVDGEPVLSHYAGLADLSVQAPIGPDTRFNIASNAKQFTALMTLDLAAAGKIDLSEDFREYLPDAMPNVDERITLRQLLTHTSGIRDIYGLWSLTGVTWYERAYRNRDAMQLINAQQGLNFEPGSEFQYSNSNYVLLAEVVSGVSGEAFHAYSRAFFDARGMDNTQVRRRYGVVVPHLARGYGNWSGWLENPSITNLHGDGFLYSTLPDQLHWENQVWGQEQTLPSEVITSSQVAIPDATGTNAYGYGVELGTYRGLPTVFHTGSTGGYNAYTLRFPSEKASIVILGNTSTVNVVALGNQIADQVLADRFTTDVPFPVGPDAIGEPQDADEYLGQYILDSGTVVGLAMRDDGLYREIAERDPVRMLPDEGNVYRYESFPELKLVLVKDADGRRSFEIHGPGQSPQYATGLDEIPAGDDYRRCLEGTFINAETDAVIRLSYSGDDAFAFDISGRSRTASLVGKDYLVSGSYRLRAQNESAGCADSLLVDIGRVRNAEFTRVD